MKKYILILILILAPAWAFALDNRAIPTDKTPQSSNFGLDTLGAYQGLISIGPSTSISFTDDGGADYITGTGFDSLVDGDCIVVSGSASNDGVYIIDDATSTKLILASTASLTNESAGESVTLAEKPTICVVNTASPTTGMSYGTRNGVPVVLGGYRTLKEWDKPNRLINLERCDEITQNDRGYLAGGSVEIRGETAPNTGPWLRGETLLMDEDYSVVTHFRTGIENSSVTASNQDGINVYGSNCIVYHTTSLWAKDEQWGCGGDNTDVAYLYSISGESLNYDSDEWDSKGAILSGGYPYDNSLVARDILSYQNFFISNVHRQWVLNMDADLAQVNDYIYNPRYYGPYISCNTWDETRDAQERKLTLAYNLTQAGPSTSSDSEGIVWGIVGSNCHQYTDQFEIWMEGNAAIKKDSTLLTQEDEDDWSLVRDVSSVDISTAESNWKVADPPVAYTLTPETANTDLKAIVLANAGAFPAYRLDVENRLVAEAISGTGGSIKTTSPGWPSPAAYAGDGNRDIGSEMDEEGLLNIPSDPFSDTDWCGGNTDICVAGDGRDNLREWYDHLLDHVEVPYTPPPEEPDDPDNSHLLSKWKFENNLTDEEGTNNLTDGGTVAYESGSPIKDSYSLDNESGDTDFLYKSSWSGLSAADGFTWTGWFKLENVSATNKTIISAWDATNSKRVFAIVVETDNLNLWMGYNGGASEYKDSVVHATDLSADTVYFGAVTYDKTSDTAKIYIRNSSCEDVGSDLTVETLMGEETWNQTEATDIMIGDYGSSGSPAHMTFDGLLDDQALYDTALSEQEIENICNETPGIPAPTISALAFTPDTIVNADIGSTIPLAMTWSEVTIITGGPTIEAVWSNGTSITFSYSSGSGTASHSYVSDPITMDMIGTLSITSSELDLNGGSAQDALDNDVTDLTLPAATGTITSEIILIGNRGISESGIGHN